MRGDKGSYHDSDDDTAPNLSATTTTDNTQSVSANANERETTQDRRQGNWPRVSVGPQGLRSGRGLCTSQMARGTGQETHFRGSFSESECRVDLYYCTVNILLLRFYLLY